MRKELGLGERDIAVISVGELAQGNTFATSIDAIAKSNDPHVSFIIYGQGPDENRLRQYVTGLGIEDRVQFLGHRYDLKDLFQAADIFMLSTQREDFSLELVAAMASGLPCVVSRVSGADRLIDDEDNGFLIEATSATEISEKIDRLSSSEKLRRQFGFASFQSLRDFLNEAYETGNRRVYEKDAKPHSLIDIEEIAKTACDFTPNWVKKRCELGIPIDSTVLISVGDLNKNKNHSVIIDALKRLQSNTIHFILCGEGEMRGKLERLANPLEGRVHFLGYRSDIKELMAASDIFLLPSKREGLSRSLMEAMVCGLPCVVSRIRGNVDLIKDGEGGLLVSPNDAKQWANAIARITRPVGKAMGERNSKNIQRYSLETCKRSLSKIYLDCIVSRNYIE